MHLLSEFLENHFSIKIMYIALSTFSRDIDARNSNSKLSSYRLDQMDLAFFNMQHASAIIAKLLWEKEK